MAGADPSQSSDPDPRVAATWRHLPPDQDPDATVTLAASTAAPLEAAAGTTGRERQVLVTGARRRRGVHDECDGIQPSLQRPVTLRFVPLASDGVAWARFATGARVAAWLEHPDVPPVHDWVEDTLIVQRLDGIDLAAWRRRHRQDPEDLLHLVEVLIRVAEVLGHAHAQGIVHRDVKPEVVLVDEHGVAWLTDWDLAVQVGETPGPAPRLWSERSACAGTLRLMASEVARADRAAIGPATDVWLLAATAWECLTDAPLHGRGSAQEMLARAATGRVAPPAPDVDPWNLWSVLAPRLVGDHSVRGSMAGFVVALRDWQGRVERLRLAESGLAEAGSLLAAVTDDSTAQADYRRLGRAILAADRAVDLGHPQAAETAAIARRRYAAFALDAGDLGLSGLVLQHLSGAEDLQDRHQRALRRVERRHRHQRLARWMAIIAAIGLAVVAGLAWRLEDAERAAAREDRAALARRLLAAGIGDQVPLRLERAKGLAPWLPEVDAALAQAYGAALDEAIAADQLVAAELYAARLGDLAEVGAAQLQRLGDRLAELRGRRARHRAERQARVAAWLDLPLAQLGDRAAVLAIEGELRRWRADDGEAWDALVRPLRRAASPALREALLRVDGSERSDAALLAVLEDPSPAVAMHALELFRKRVYARSENGGDGELVDAIQERLDRREAEQGFHLTLAEVWWGIGSGWLYRRRQGHLDQVEAAAMVRRAAAAGTTPERLDLLHDWFAAVGLPRARVAWRDYRRLRAAGITEELVDWCLAQVADADSPGMRVQMAVLLLHDGGAKAASELLDGLETGEPRLLALLAWLRCWAAIIATDRGAVERYLDELLAWHHGRIWFEASGLLAGFYRRVHDPRVDLIEKLNEELWRIAGFLQDRRHVVFRTPIDPSDPGADLVRGAHQFADGASQEVRHRALVDLLAEPTEDLRWLTLAGRQDEGSIVETLWSLALARVGDDDSYGLLHAATWLHRPEDQATALWYARRSWQAWGNNEWALEVMAQKAIGLRSWGDLVDVLELMEARGKGQSLVRLAQVLIGLQAEHLVLDLAERKQAGGRSDQARYLVRQLLFWCDATRGMALLSPADLHRMRLYNAWLLLRSGYDDSRQRARELLDELPVQVDADAPAWLLRFGTALRAAASEGAEPIPLLAEIDQADGSSWLHYVVNDLRAWRARRVAGEEDLFQARGWGEFCIPLAPRALLTPQDLARIRSLPAPGGPAELPESLPGSADRVRPARAEFLAGLPRVGEPAIRERVAELRRAAARTLAAWKAEDAADAAALAEEP